MFIYYDTKDCNTEQYSVVQYKIILCKNPYYDAPLAIQIPIWSTLFFYFYLIVSLFHNPFSLTLSCCHSLSHTVFYLLYFSYIPVHVRTHLYCRCHRGPTHASSLGAVLRKCFRTVDCRRWYQRLYGCGGKDMVCTWCSFTVLQSRGWQGVFLFFFSFFSFLCYLFYFIPLSFSLMTS